MDVVLLLMLMMTTISQASRMIHLVTGVIDTENTPQIHEEDHPSPHFKTLSYELRLQDPLRSGFMVQIDPSKRDTLRSSLPMTLYIPDHTFIIFVSHEEADRIRGLDGVKWVGNIRPEHKIAPEIAQLQASLSSTTSSSNTMLSISLIVSTMQLPNDEDSGFIMDRLKLLAGSSGAITVIRSDRLRIDLNNVSNLQVQALCQIIAGDPAVLYIEKRLKPKWMNRWTRGILNNGLTSSANYDTMTGLIGWDHGLYGAGQVIGVADSGIDTNHCFFSDANGVPISQYRSNPTAADFPAGQESQRKIVQYVAFADAADDEDGHGTHVAGIAAGSAEIDGMYSKFNGMAPESKLAFFDIGMANGDLNLPDDLTSMFQWSYVAGARIHSNSWGTEAPQYTSLSRDMDQYMYAHDDFLILVAAGNDGACGQQTTIGSPATAKNIITVGSCMTDIDSYNTLGITPPLFSSFPTTMFDANNIATFSSRGPTSDSRIKPDIVAPGFAAMSAKVAPRGSPSNVCGQPDINVLTVKSGTSMSTPAAAGALALIREYFIEGFYPTGRRNQSHSMTPSGSLMKAIAVAGGKHLTGTRLVTDQFTVATQQQKCPNIQFASIDQFPGVDQGWGRLQLDQVLEFRETSSSPFYLYLLGGTHPSIANSQSHTYSMCVMPSPLSTAPTRIVLVWTDPPGQPQSAIQLVNDLDLIVEYNRSDQIHLGNEGAYDGVATADRRNPIETILINAPTMSDGPIDMKIIVNAAAINIGQEQRYSLVVTGLARPYNCQEAASNEDDKGFLTPLIATSPSNDGNRSGFASASVFKGVIIAAAVIGTCIICLVVGAVVLKIRYSTVIRARGIN